MILKSLFSKCIVILYLFILSIFCMGISPDNDKDDLKNISKNIYIQDIDVSNLTKKEAINSVSKKYTPGIIKLNYGEKYWEIKPEDISLNYNVEEAINKAYNYTRTDNPIENIKRLTLLYANNRYNIELHATYDEAKLSEIIQKICEEINVAVQEATIHIEDNSRIIKTESKPGKEVDLIDNKEAIYSMIKNKSTKEIDLSVNIIPPTISTEDVNSINTVLAQFTTTFNDTTARGYNIHVAGKSTSDRIIMPGDEFSYNKSTGARTWHNGYRTAKVIINGKYVNGEGGGVCQVSTTIYNAALYAGLDIIEVHSHTLPSHYTSMGRDASVSYGYTDLKFENPYNHPIYIKNIVNKGSITTKIYGCNKDRQNIEIRTAYKFEKDYIMVDTYRIFYSNGKKIKEERITTSKYNKAH